MSRDWLWNGNTETIHLKVDVPSLTATDGPLSLYDDDGNSGDATLAGLLDLIFDCLDVFVRLEIFNSLT